MMEPLVSVIMPAYNAEKYIEAAIRSVQAQTLTDWELLVIDDGSSDSTCAIVERFAAEDSRIRFLVNSQNMGTAKTRNRGLDLCRGKYVAFLDSDDIWHPEKLFRQIDLAEKSDADLIYTSYAIINEQGVKICDDFAVEEKVSIHSMLKKNSIGCSTVLLKRETTSSFRFSSDYYHEDYVLWLQMLQAGKVAVGITEVMVDYRFYTGSRASNKVASAKRRWQIYRSYMRVTVLKSLYFSVCYALNGSMKYRNKEQKQYE